MRLKQFSSEGVKVRLGVTQAETKLFTQRVAKLMLIQVERCLVRLAQIFDDGGIVLIGHRCPQCLFHPCDGSGGVSH